MHCGLLFLLAFSLNQVESKTTGGVEDMKKLHRVLFNDYNVYARPAFDYSRATKVQILLSVTSLLGLDIKNQVLKLKGYFRLHWQDELLTWNQTDYGGIEYISAPQTKLWRPDMVFTNAADDVAYLGSDETLLLIRSTGQVQWEPSFDVHATCTVDISKYPFDENVCPVIVQPWAHNNDTLQLEPMIIGDPISLKRMTPNGEFKVSSAGYKIELDAYEDLFFEKMTFSLKISRRPAYIALSLLMPITMLAVLCVVSFLLSPEEPEKVTVSITVLLSFTVFLGVIDNDLPETSDNLSYLVVYISLLQALGFLSVVGNTIVLAVNRMDKESNHQTLTSADRTSVESEKNNDVLKTIAQTGEDFQTKSNGKWQPINSMEQKESGVEVVNQTNHQTRAYRLNKLFFIMNSTALIVVISVIGFLLMH